MIKNIIFDWSGVINDNTETVYCAAMAIFKKHGIKELSYDDFRKEWIMPYIDFYRLYIPKFSVEEEHNLYVSAYKKCPKPKLYLGIEELLLKCKKVDKKLYVVSSDPKEQIFSEIKEWGLSGLFDEVHYELVEKTDSVREIVKKNNLSKKETIFIGDTDYEIQVGKDVGIISAGVTWGAHYEDRLKAVNPDYLFHNLKEMEEVILKT